VAASLTCRRIVCEVGAVVLNVAVPTVMSVVPSSGMLVFSPFGRVNEKVWFALEAFH